MLRWQIALLTLFCAILASQGVAQVEASRNASARAENLAREKWQMSGRRAASTASAELRRRAIQQKSMMRVARAMSAAGGSSSSATWSSLGPLPLPSDASGTGLQDYGWVSGRATAVAIDPNDLTGNTVFVGGAYGGLWKSSNAGAMTADPANVSWVPLTDNQATLAIGAIAVQPQPSNPNPRNSIVVAGTGETDSSADSYYGLGILRSADGGQTWTLISQDSTGTHSFAGLGFSQIAFSSANPNLVVAAAASASEGIVEGLENPVAVNRGLYVSTDAGLSWQMAKVADAGVSISPASVSSVVFSAAAGKFYAAIRFHGFYSSSDGINWTRLATQPGSILTTGACPAQTQTPSSCPIYRAEVAVVPKRAGANNLGEMYVWYVDANGIDQGIWESVDGGSTWSQINDSGISNCGDLFGGCGTSQGTYNLALAAVPNGSFTDLYAGAANLYKCTINGVFPNCSGTGSNTFLNLTHVYGCSDIAKVHPDQHAIDFLVANGTALLYFANDGGIDRALDGFTGLTTGTCGLTNQFDNLNATLGPMTQFVSISGSASDAGVVLGGTQDNGAPGSASSQSGEWGNVEAGDVGFTAINPANENDWFLAMPPDANSGVNLFRCTNGPTCHTQDFQNGQVADGNQLGGDTGAFYLPFILDPASSSTLLVGTCRIWRGASSGGAFTLLSPNFETSGDGACSGTETNLVRALAAGGPTNSAGLSRVIYVGTNGEGPLIATSPAGGHVWVTTSADAGAASWADRTGIINPNQFPISSIAIDSSDATGQTAYVGVMGFHTAHVWKTANAGQSWTDFTGSALTALPDAPVNALVIDSSAGMVYAGTDVGVFATSTGVPSWSEVGPAPGPNASGFLPDVAVSALQIVNYGTTKGLRAATYGRGIWTTLPDFQLSVANNPLTMFAGQSATYNGSVTARNGYASSITLSCASGITGPPQSCVVVPPSITPNPQASFVLNAGGPVGDYLFNLQATGSDPANVNHEIPLTLHVVDFNLAPPVPSSLAVTPGASAQGMMQVSAAGDFTGSVNLACLGLPFGASCQFQPSSTVNPTSLSPVSLILNVATTSMTPLGQSQITISATTSGGPTKTQTLSLTVSSAATAPTYTIAVAVNSLTAQVNSPAVFRGTLTSINGYASAVSLSCGGDAPPTCNPSPSTIVPTASGASFTLSASSGTAQPYPFSINAVGSDANSISQSLPVTLTVLPNQSFDFTLGANPSNASIAVGTTATYTVAVAPTTGTFPTNVSFTCSGLPALSACTFNPAQIGSGTSNAVVSLNVSTTAPGPPSSAALLLMSSPAVGLFGIRRRRSQPKRQAWLSLLIFLLTLLLFGCGGGLQGNGSTSGGGSPGTPKGSYNLTVTASSGGVSHSATVTLTVTN